VIAEGRHIATLYSGQVLTEPPSKAGFQRVARDVQSLSYIDVKDLEESYWNVPVVSDRDIENTVRILELYADFLARLWQRLGDAVKAERSKLRSRQLAAKEFAYLILQPEIQDRTRLFQLMKQLGFVQAPNRVMVVKVQNEEEFHGQTRSFDAAFTGAMQALEELAERSRQMAVAYLRRRGVCVFFRDLTEGRSAGLRARSLSEKILYQISSRSDIPVRIGIGGLKADWQHVAESYHEACLALAGSEDVVATCQESRTRLGELTAQIEIACRQLADQQIRDACLTLRSLPLLANRRIGGNALTDQRNFFSSALESLCFTALKAGCDGQSISRAREDTQRELVRAATIFDVQSAFLEGSETIADEIGRLWNGKHEKVIARVQQMLDRRLKAGKDSKPLSLAAAAKTLGVSTGHLSRTFRRLTGMTFREYAISRRVEHARRLLLDRCKTSAAFPMPAASRHPGILPGSSAK
jgi:AraC-like DNA-binding protein